MQQFVLHSFQEKGKVILIQSVFLLILINVTLQFHGNLHIAQTCDYGGFGY